MIDIQSRISPINGYKSIYTLEITVKIQQRKHWDVRVKMGLVCHLSVPVEAPSILFLALLAFVNIYVDTS